MPMHTHGLLSCQIRDGVPVLSGRARGYYVSRGAEGLVLVVTLNPGRQVQVHADVRTAVLPSAQRRQQIAFCCASADEPGFSSEHAGESSPITG